MNRWPYLTILLGLAVALASTANQSDAAHGNSFQSSTVEVTGTPLRGFKEPEVIEGRYRSLRVRTEQAILGPNVGFGERAPILGHAFESPFTLAPAVPSSDSTNRNKAQAVSQQRDEFEPGVLLVGLDKGRTWQQFEMLFAGQGVNRQDTLLQFNVHKVSVPAGQEDKYIRLIRQVPGVAYAEPNFYQRLHILPQSPPLVIGPPQLLSPPDGSTANDFRPVLLWSSPQATKVVHLTVFPANNDGAGVNLILEAATSFIIPPPPEWYGLLPDMTYTWRVRASDAEDIYREDDPRWGPWSAAWIFRTPPASGASTTPRFPKTGEVVPIRDPFFWWADSNPYVFYYEVQLSPDSTFNTDPATATAFVFWVLLHGGVTRPLNSYSLPPGVTLDPGWTYYWRVRPRVQGDGTPAAWSPTWNFQIASTAGVAPSPTATATPVSAPIATVTSTPIAQSTPSGFSGVAPNDPRYSLQWNLRKINALGAWRKTTGSASVTVAIIDSGVDLGHPELAGSVVPGYSCVPGTTAPQDDNGHGTHVAGTVDAKGNNGLGVAGVAWNVRIMPVKVADWEGEAAVFCTAKGIEYAVNRGARVINLSLGGTGRSTAEEQAVNYALQQGAVVVAAAGNEGDQKNLPSYPAAFPGVLAVAATGSDDERASYSNYGSYVQIAAPGGTYGRDGILSTCWREASCQYRDGYTYHNGTSMASPHVAGLAALILSAKPELSGAQVADIIKRSAVDLGPRGKDDQYGYGRIDAAAAVALALGTDSPVSTPTRTPTPLPTIAALSFGPITFGTGLGPNEPACELIGIGSTFPAGTNRVYYRHDYTGAGYYTRNWYVGGQLVASRVEYEEGPSGCAYSFIYGTSTSPLLPGTYKLELVVNSQVARQAIFVIAAPTVATATATAIPTPTAPLTFGTITFGTGVADEARCLLSGAGTDLTNVGSRLYARYDYSGGGIFTSTWYLNDRKVAGPSVPYALEGPSGCTWEYLYTSDSKPLPFGTYRLALSIFGSVVRSGTVTVTAPTTAPTVTPSRTPTATPARTSTSTSTATSTPAGANVTVTATGTATRTRTPTPTNTRTPTATPTPTGPTFGSISFGNEWVGGAACIINDVRTTFPAGTREVIGRYDYAGSGSYSARIYRNGVLFASGGPYSLPGPSGCDAIGIANSGAPLPGGSYRLDLTVGGVVARSGSFSVQQ